jgi:sodium-coupled neutral amino acid transporter 11
MYSKILHSLVFSSNDRDVPTSAAVDTIPHATRFMFPNLPSLYRFADHRFITAFTTICVSYPLSLCRDLHKLSIASSFALRRMLIIVALFMFESKLVPPLLKGDPPSLGFFKVLGSSALLKPATTIRN